MKDDLLWVYEGLTEYLGEVLTARSGCAHRKWHASNLLPSPVPTKIARGATGGRCKTHQTAAVFLYDAGGDWSNWRRGVDFYDEGQLLWLDVDTTIRRLTNDQKSITDFCRAFHGGPGGEPALKPYTFEDIVAGLNSVAPFDLGGIPSQAA